MSTEGKKHFSKNAMQAVFPLPEEKMTVGKRLTQRLHFIRSVYDRLNYFFKERAHVLKIYGKIKTASEK